jgi:hypothetical protein
VRIEVKTLMSNLGLDPARFGAHSLRIGGATAAAAAGVPPSVIRVMGRWNSDIFEIYTRLTQQAAARMTGVIGSTAFDDLERGAFHTEELELLPSEMDVAPEFDGNDELVACVSTVQHGRVMGDMCCFLTKVVLFFNIRIPMHINAF